MASSTTTLPPQSPRSPLVNASARLRSPSPPAPSHPSITSQVDSPLNGKTITPADAALLRATPPPSSKLLSVSSPRAVSEEPSREAPEAEVCEIPFLISLNQFPLLSESHIYPSSLYILHESDYDDDYQWQWGCFVRSLVKLSLFLLPQFGNWPNLNSHLIAHPITCLFSPTFLSKRPYLTRYALIRYFAYPFDPTWNPRRVRCRVRPSPFPIPPLDTFNSLVKMQTKRSQ